MTNYLICTDSTCDLPKEYKEKNNIMSIFLTYTLDGMNCPDDESSSISSHEFYDSMRNGKLPVTSQLNATQFTEKIEPLVKAGNDILFIAFSSGLSGTYQSCCMGADELREKYPDRKIIVIDSLCASLGEGLLVHYAAKNLNNGMSLEENAEWIENNKLNVCHEFTVEDLNHLHRLGRVSKTTALLGSLIGIKPVMHMDDNGKLTVVSKARGRMASLDKMVDTMMKLAIEPEKQDIFISHGDCVADAEKLADKVENKFGKRPCLINYVGSVIGSHSGPGTLALFYIGTHR